MTSPSSEPEAIALTAPAKSVVTKKEWLAIEQAWKAGTVTYADLVKTYSRSVSTFERHFKSRGIVKGSNADKIREKVEENLEKELVDDATVMAARIKETKEEHYKMASALGRLMWSEIIAAKQSAKPISAANSNLRTLEIAISGLKKVREERYAVLGLDRPDAIDPDQVPELIISELSAEEIQILRDRDITELDASPTIQLPLDDVTALPDDEVIDESDEP